MCGIPHTTRLLVLASTSSLRKYESALSSKIVFKKPYTLERESK